VDQTEGIGWDTTWLLLLDDRESHFEEAKAIVSFSSGFVWWRSYVIAGVVKGRDEYPKGVGSLRAGGGAEAEDDLAIAMTRSNMFSIALTVDALNGLRS
jgi:hypothetical protein